jgi:hypothetical protein
VAVLATNGDHPHAIPVSTAVRAGDRRVLLALGRSRRSLARLRADAHVTLTLLCEGDVACTARGHARVVAEELPAAPGVAGVLIEVEHVEEHGTPAFQIDAGVRWHWLDEDAQARDATVRAALEALA